MKTLTIQSKLEDSQIETIARSLGWSETTPKIDENGTWSHVENTTTHEEHIVNYFTNIIKSTVKEIYTTSKRNELMESIEPMMTVFVSEVEKNIESSLSSSIE
jgi:hypothetical protein